MSRGTRRGDDVLCVGDGPDPEEEDPHKLPELFPYPKGFRIGTGRIQFLNTRLFKFYGDIGFYHNEYRKACEVSENNTVLQGMDNWLATHNTNQERLDQNYRLLHDCCHEAAQMLIELRALGAMIYVPEELEPKYVQQPAQLAQPGSMSYLCSAPYYFSPENYPVPRGLPAVAVKQYSKTDKKTLAGSNRFLSMKYGVLAMNLNRIKFYRDQRIQSKLDLSISIPGNILEGKIESCRSLLALVVDELWKCINRGEKNQLFHMPRALRDNILEENAIVNLTQLKDISCLYPEGGMPVRSPTYTYLLYESVMGYSLFRVYGVAAEAELLSPLLLELDRFKTYVKLVDHYPFTSVSAQLEHSKYISKAIVSDELRLFLQLNLPLSGTMNWQYILGVRDPNLAQLIQNESKIPCVSGAHVDHLFRGVHQHINAFLEIESTQVDLARLKIGRLLTCELLRTNLTEAIHSVDMVDRNIRSLSLNVRKMYSMHFPELDGIVEDNCLYARLVKCIGNKTHLLHGDAPALRDVIGQQDLVKLITDSAKSSIGQDLSQSDLDMVFLSADNILILVETREKLFANLVEHMRIMTPNLAVLVGSDNAARLILFAGSQLNLIHLLLDMRRHSSSFSDGGILWNSEFVARATCTATKMRMASYLASSCYSAFCEDYFTGTCSSSRGEVLYTELEDKLKYVETSLLRLMVPTRIPEPESSSSTDASEF